ncbi:MAG: biotin--protein ligase [Candidatus Nanohaloarchaeota archaeon QJJ-5]|nr:biotin--protein ligase [Candidatus Nanohaloarchaeota archaeon QJJ-5]
MTKTAEYKVPDGKLLRADVAANGEITAVSLHGDFFIYPETALDDITTALEGCKTDMDEQTMTQTIKDNLDTNTKLVGFRPSDVTAVVKQALEADTDEQ